MTSVARARPGRVLAAATAAAAALIVLAACGAPAPRPSATAAAGTPRGYVTCLLRHLKAGQTAGVRKACRSLKPPGGLGPVLLKFSACLTAHGVTLPSPAAGASAAPGATALSELEALQAGRPAQRAAVSTCAASL
jgi:hypothetical protein